MYFKILNIKKYKPCLKTCQGWGFIGCAAVVFTFFGVCSQVTTNYKRAQKQRGQQAEVSMYICYICKYDITTHTLTWQEHQLSLLVPDVGSQGLKRWIPDTWFRINSYMHTASTSICCLAMSRTCSLFSQQGFSQWQDCVSWRSHDLSAWSLHVTAGPLQLPPLPPTHPTAV